MLRSLVFGRTFSAASLAVRAKHQIKLEKDIETIRKKREEAKRLSEAKREKNEIRDHLVLQVMFFILMILFFFDLKTPTGIRRVTRGRIFRQKDSRGFSTQTHRTDNTIIPWEVFTKRALYKAPYGHRVEDCCR